MSGLNTGKKTVTHWLAISLCTKCSDNAASSFIPVIRLCFKTFCIELSENIINILKHTYRQRFTCLVDFKL